MLKELNAALVAAKKYKIRNDGDRPHADLVVRMLGDCIAHAEQLGELADAHEKDQAVREAQEALTVAQAAQAG